MVTMGTDVDMSGRVGSSILTALGLTELITYEPNEYVALAVRLGKYPNMYDMIRKKLVHTTRQRPMNPFWDLERFQS